MNATKKILMYSIMLVMLMVYGVSYAQTTVTVDGVAVDFATLVVNITTVAEPPEPPIDPPIDPEPPIPPEPPSDCGATPPNGKVESWVSAFNATFPAPKSRQKVVSIPRNGGWYAVVFNTGNFIAKGGLANFEASSTVGSREISISQCKGEFRDVPNECWQWVGASQRAIPWSTTPRNGYCLLEKSTTYYFNVRFNVPCTGTYCNTTVRATNRDL